MAQQRVVKGTILLFLLLFAVSLATAANVPAGEWTFDEGSGQTVLDSSGNNNDGTLGQDSSSEGYDPDWMPESSCVSGTCLEFGQQNPVQDGEFVTVPDDPSLAVDNVTLAAWVYPTSYQGNNDNAIFAKEQQYKIALANGNDTGEDEGELLGSIYNSGWHGNDGQGWEQSNTVIPLDTWTHVAMTYNESHYKFYVDGSHVHTDKASVSSPTPIADNNYALGIGGRDPLGEVGSPTYFFDGRIDNPVVYTRVLNDSEIADLTDVTPPTMSDNHSSTAWHNTSQPVTMQCEDSDTGCVEIDWELQDPDSNVIDQDTESSSSTPVLTTDMVASTDGDLTLFYTGTDDQGNAASDSTIIRIDTQPPATSIPDDNNWYEDDITKSISDTDQPDLSGLDQCQYKVKDGSDPWPSSWSSRTCDSDLTVTVGQTGSGSDCTTEGTDACGIRVRAIDNAGNDDIDTAFYNIDYSPTDIYDNYTSDEWKNKSQPVQITCTDGVDDCNQIDWRIIRDGDIVVPDGSDYNSVMDTETTVFVGDQYDGELELEYRGWNQNWEPTDWHSQLVRVDKTGPISEILGPDEDQWRNTDFEVHIEDRDDVSGLGQLDIYYIADTSGSFYDEWDTLSENVDFIRTELESRTELDVSYTVWGLNNSWDGRGGSGAMCHNDQDLPDSLDPDTECDRNDSVIDDMSQTKPYIDWLCDEFGDCFTVADYDPDGRGEAPKEGWGMGILDIYERGTWRSDAHRSIVNVGDQDTNGGDDRNDWCGDDESWELAEELNESLDDENILAFSLLGDTECDSETPDPSREQMDLVGDVLDYNETDEMPDLILDALDQFRPDSCEYRVSGDNGNTWSDWQQRDCPDGNVTVTVGPPGSGANCTQSGENMCHVETRVENSGGNIGRDVAMYDIDVTPPQIVCDDGDGDCDRPEPVIVRNDVSFLPDVTDPHSGPDHVFICRGNDESCPTQYCDFDASQSSCAHPTTFPYGNKHYCVRAQDTLGNEDTVCSSNFFFSVMAGLGDACTIDQQCAIGACIGGTCSLGNLPPPEIVLH